MEQEAIAKELHDQLGRRACSYPTIQEQLDMLYHDIKDGKLDSGQWITAIENIKNKYPKPEGV